MGPCATQPSKLGRPLLSASPGSCLCPAGLCGLYQLPVSTCARQHGFLSSGQLLETTPPAAWLFFLSTGAGTDKLPVLGFSLCPWSVSHGSLSRGLLSWSYDGFHPLLLTLLGTVWCSLASRLLLLSSGSQETQC